MVFDECLAGLSEPPRFSRFQRWSLRPNGDLKLRIYYAPNDAMRMLHHRLMQLLRSQPSFPRGIPRSPAHNAAPHRKHRYFYQTDIVSAFESVRMGQLIEALCALNCAWRGKQHEHEMEQFLLYYCFAVEGGLARGAPASPMLFDIFASILVDEPIRAYCKSQRTPYGITYTRYVDDLTFSSRCPIGSRRRRTLREYIEAAGLTVNHRKSRVCDLKKGAVVVTGIGIELGGRMFARRYQIAKLRGMLRKALREGAGAVNGDELNGMMSVFWSPFGGKSSEAPLNATERKVLALWEQYRSLNS